MITHHSPQSVQETTLRWKAEGKIAFVPTMGCLHDGHFALIRRARELGKRVVVSIFVNPLQFGPQEDFASYPRTLEEDRERLESLNVDLLFAPQPKDLYGDSFASKVSVGDITTRLCGQYRPGHFDGVATICLKLFNITQADIAVFGEKDFQQLRVVQQMTGDLNLPVSIVPHATVREADGLALSSRNRYLSSEERHWAKQIPETLTQVRERALKEGAIRVEDILKLAESTLTRSPLRIQYVAVTHGRGLKLASDDEYVNALSLPHFFVAAFAGTTRLIDNISLNGIHS